MNKKTLIILAVALILIALVTIIVFQGRQTDNASSKYGIEIDEQELTSEIERLRKFYEESGQDLANYPSLEDDTMERLVEKMIIENYAIENDIKVDDKEVAERYEGSIKREGSEQILLDKLNKMYGINKSNYLERVKMDILREKVQEKVKMPLAEWLIEEKKAYREN